MKNKHQDVKILENSNELVTVKFLDSGLVMSLPTDLLQQKVQGGFYSIVETKVKAN